MAKRSAGARRAKPQSPAKAEAASALNWGAAPWPRSNWLPGLILIVAVFLAYLPVWRAGFVWDDDLHLTANPCIVGPLGLGDIWTRGGALQSFPLVITTFWLEHALWGLHPLPYHLVNVFLQAASAILLWQILRRLQVPGAWLGAALWALHPLQVESVAWVAEMKNTESGVFYLLAIWFYTGSLTSEKVRRGVDWNYILTLLFSALAMASKPTTVVLPAVLFLCGWWMGTRWDRRSLLRLLPVVAMAVLATINATCPRPPYEDALPAAQWERSWPERVAMAGDIFWFYVGKLAWPSPLMMVYPRWHIDAAQLTSYLPLVAMILLYVYLWLKRNSWLRPAFFAFTYFLVALAPFLGLIEQSFWRFSFVEDHLQYLAAMGPLALAGAGITRLTNRLFVGQPWLQAVPGALLLVILGAASWQRATVFKNPETLWGDTLAKNPACWVGYYDLGNVMVRQGQTEAAMDDFARAVALNPNFDKAHNNLGNALLGLGRVDEAIVQLEDALAINPKDYSAYVGLADAFIHQGNTDEAVAQLQKAIAIAPEYYLAHLSLANALLFRKGDVDDAITQYQLAVNANPGSVNAHNYYGLALVQKGQLSQAILQFEEALRLKPDDKTAHDNLLRTEEEEEVKPRQ